MLVFVIPKLYEQISRSHIQCVDTLERCTDRVILTPNTIRATAARNAVLTPAEIAGRPSPSNTECTEKAFTGNQFSGVPRH
jgi:hypothetical protein